jgi:hypothetical protein
VTIESVAGIISAAPSEARRRGGQREDDDTEEEHAAAPEDVPETAAGRQQHREGERVAVDDPFQAGERGAEVALDRRQRHVHDRVVEHDHEQREAHRAERPPLAVLVGDQVAIASHLSMLPHRAAFLCDGCRRRPG